MSRHDYLLRRSLMPENRNAIPVSAINAITGSELRVRLLACRRMRVS